jgi:dihydroorotase
MFEQGYLPDTISTDLNIFNIGGPVFHLAETMSKVWALGVDLASVVAMASSNTARAIGRGAEMGSLAVGRVADVSVMRIVDGPVPLSDGHETVVAEHGLVPVGCTRAGTWYPCEPLPTYKTAGRTWAGGSDDEDW